MLTATSPPLKGAGGMFITESCKKLFSLISPLKEVRELAQRSMCKGGDVNNKEQFAQIRYAKVIKKYQSAKKIDCPFWGQSRLLKNIDELITLNYFVEVSFKHPNVLFLTRDKVAH